jgi:hypothetical protein
VYKREREREREAGTRVPAVPAAGREREEFIDNQQVTESRKVQRPVGQHRREREKRKREGESI